MTTADDTNSGALSPGTVVCFQDQGVPRPGVIVSLIGSRFEIADTEGNQSKFAADRFTAFSEFQVPINSVASELKVKLDAIWKDALAAAEGISLPEVWEKCPNLSSPVSSEDIFDSCNFESRGDLIRLALHLLLLKDKIYFKQRGQLFQRRTSEEVSERLRQADEQRQHAIRLTALVDLIVTIATGRTPAPASFPQEIGYLEDLAAFGSDARDFKEARVLLERIEAQLGAQSAAPEADRAFELLLRVGHFTPDQNLTLIRFGLDRIAQPTLTEFGKALQDLYPNSFVDHQDLTMLDCFTIDGDRTEDFDDAFSVEELPGGGYRVGVHITDVWSALHSDTEKFNSAVQELIQLGTSVYLPDKTIHMLPRELSERLLSLRAGEIKLALSLLVDFDGNFLQTGVDFSLSRIRISRNLTYDSANDIMTADPDSGVSKLWQIATEVEQRRLLRPSHSFDRQEIEVKVSDSGEVSVQTYENDTPAHKIVGELMILFNSEAARLGKRNKLPLLYRSQAAPETDPATAGLDLPPGPARDNLQRSFFQRTVTECRPFPHTGLGLDCYLQATSPLRRFVDLLNQGQLISFISRGQTNYPAKMMHELFREVEPALDRAQIAQRERIRYFLLKYLEARKDAPLSGVFIKVDHGQCYVELEETLIQNSFESKIPVTTPEQIRRQLGRTVSLKISEINPRGGNLRLTEA